MLENDRTARFLKFRKKRSEFFQLSIKLNFVPRTKNDVIVRRVQPEELTIIELGLSLVYVDEDSKTLWLNGDEKYKVTIPKNLLNKPVAEQNKLI